MGNGKTHGRHEKPKQNTAAREKKAPARERACPEEYTERSEPRRSRERKPASKAADASPNIRKILSNLLITVILVAALSVLLATFKMPVIRVYGDAMMPLLGEGDIALGMKDVTIRPGDVVGVYYGNKLLTKRCVAAAGQTVEIDASGIVSVNGVPLDEPYAVNKAALAETADIETPYTVPQGHIFVLGDNRGNPADSRSVDVGCFKLEDVCGRLICRIWPLPMKAVK